MTSTNITSLIIVIAVIIAVTYIVTHNGES